ncbi:MAG: hypothetical protein R6V59_03955 [Dehalococcoidia bacterium]
MRLSRKVWLIVGIGVIVILIAVLASTYFRQVEELGQLEDRLAVAQTRLPGLIADKQELENDLARARSAVATNRARYPETIHSIEYGEHIFDIARKCNVTLSGLSFPRPTNSQVGPVTYSVVTLSLPISGTRDNIFEFIQTIRTDPRFASTRVNSVSMGGGSATISVTIYAYKGE